MGERQFMLGLLGLFLHVQGSALNHKWEVVRSGGNSAQMPGGMLPQGV